MSQELPEAEKEALEIIKSRGIMMTKQMPRDLSGAIPSLVRKGLVEVFKRRVTPFSEKKAKYIRPVE